MAVQWQGKIEARRIELLKQGYSYSAIAKILTNEFKIVVTPKAIEMKCAKSNTRKKDLDIYSEYSNEEKIIVKNKSTTLFPEESYSVDEEICMTPAKIAQLKEFHEAFTTIRPNKILSLSDLHAPYINFKAVEQAILDNLDADICVLNGDVYDGQAMSSFDKMKEFDIEVEFKQIFTLLDVLTEKFKYVVWIGGNHDMDRFMRFVMRNFGPGMRNFVAQRLNPMDYIAEKYDNLFIVPHNWCQIGDVIFAHLPNFSTVEMKTVINVNDIFNAMRPHLPNPNYRAVIIGHTHHLGYLVKNDVFLGEQGCMCHLYDYRFNQPTKLSWQTGYASIVFDIDTKMDFAKSSIVYVK